MERGATTWFPPGWPAADARSNAPRGLRRFGEQLSDLSVDFSDLPRPELITELLSLCCRSATGAPVAREALLEMPVGVRTEAIVLLGALSDARAYEWQMTCATPACGVRSEFQLSVEQILTLGAEY